MKSRLLYLLKFYIVFIIIFVVMKVGFMIYNANQSSFSVGDIAEVIFNGFPLDLSTISYLVVVPWLVCLISVWLDGLWIKRSLLVYNCVIAFIVAMILIVDCALYEFWQFKLDATILNYIDSPKDVLASISMRFVIFSILAIASTTLVIILALKAIGKKDFDKCTNKPKTSGILIIAGLLIFLFIRGGVDRSTMNVGRVYYSQNQFLNHSAVNPAFSLVSSMFKVNDFGNFYNYFSERECNKIFSTLAYSTQSEGDEELLNTKTPNIVVILMEGMCGTFVESVGGEKGVTPNLNKLSDEGVLFSQCYANSFRTDRGVVCTLSGYPAFPDFSVMKLPEKSRTLPSIASSLLANGYSTSFVYGGDINFTNTKSFLLSTGFSRITSEEDFPLSVRHTHSWGVTDHIVLDTLYKQIIRQPQDKPFFMTCLTLASHEDWEVPYNRIANNPKANSMAYLDDCIGKLVARLKQSPQWENLLLVFIPDHGINYPEGTTESKPQRYHIPLIWAGGAVKSHKDITTLCNQTDLAATLLGQLGINHDKFSFSRDILSKTYTYPFAVHTFGRGVSFIDSTGITVEDLNSKHILNDSPKPNSNRLRYAHAILQKTVDDFAKR